MSSVWVPNHATILVIGGGPAGSYAASALKREGHEVVLFEAARFPRYHVGESMLPPLRNHLKFIGLEEDFESHGFLMKPGASFKLCRDIRETWTDFGNLGPEYLSWNVIRSEMDDLMLRHASKQGVRVFQETRIDSIDFEGEPDCSRPIAAHWSNKHGASGKITFDWLVDASGRAGVLSTKYLKNREMREALRNVAVWGYWKGVKRYAEDTPKSGSAWFEALTDETGWSWTIPLHDGTTSIGFVMHQSASNAKKTKPNHAGKKMSLTEHYLDQLQHVPGVRELVGEKGVLIADSVKSAADYSYFATRYSGDHFRIIGDAANFVDPFFSSGVHIAMTGALAAAITICASIKGEVPEAVAQAWHDTRIGVAHTRFLFVVLGAYQQMRLQSTPMLSDIRPKDFDSAFQMFRPAMFGLADTSTQLTDSKVKGMMDMLQCYFDPNVDNEDMKNIRSRYGAEVMDLKSPVMGHEKIQQFAYEDESSQRAMRKLDAFKVFRDDMEATSLGRQVILGYHANMLQGALGLIKETNDEKAGVRAIDV